MRKNNFINFFQLTIIMLLLNTSCTDIDEVRENSQGEASSVATTVKSMNDGVLSVYTAYLTALQLNDMVAPTWSGDDITVIADKGEFLEFDQRKVSASNNRTASAWRNLQLVLSRTAQVIELYDDFQLRLADDASEEDKVNFDILRSELFFLRASVFHYFVRVHGKAPLTLDRFKPAEKLSSPLETYMQIEKDLQAAIKGLPDVHPFANEVEKGPGFQRPNKGAAEALLARVYIDWAGFPVKDQTKYKEAAELTKTIIDKSETYGFSLLQDFESLWLVENAKNSESVFAFGFINAFGRDNRKYGPVGLPGGENTNDAGEKLNGWDETFAEIRFFEDFPENDRKEGTFRTDLKWREFSPEPSPVYTKIAGPPGNLAFGSFQTERSDFLIRYADVLLMHAEASGRSGNSDDDAWEALNKVRRRAEGLPFDVKDENFDLKNGDGDLAELAFTERKWEFAGEFLRWYDLIRMERVAEALSTENRTPLDSDFEIRNPILGSLGTDNYFAPIPAAILSDNPGFSQ